MLKRSLFVWGALALLAVMPAFSFDFPHYRSDSSQLSGTSIGQQSSNQAYNLHESTFDASSSNLGIYWKGAFQNEGGTDGVGFGALPPTADLKDNREEERDIDW